MFKILLTKTVIMKWSGTNKKYYIEKGYKYTKHNDEFEVKVEDLMRGSDIKVEVKCDCLDCKNPYPKKVGYGHYLKSIHDNGKYYCDRCATILFGIEKMIKSKLKNSKSFEQWCLDNDRQDILDRWDYKLNNLSPSEIGYGVTKTKFWFKCPKGIHESELKNIQSFTYGKSNIDCIACNSFAQWGIDNLGEDFLSKYWDYEKNIINPWSVGYGSCKKIWIKCQEKDYHGSYKTNCNSFCNGNRCAYCSNRGGKIHPKDSLGTLYPQVLNIWSDKNKKTPYEYAPQSIQKVWWKCPDDKHKDFKRGIQLSNICEFRCPDCQFSKGEKKIEDWLVNNNFIKVTDKEYNNLLNKNINKYYIPQKEFDGLIGLGNGNLSYDFYLPNYNLLIEYQGKFHDGTSGYQTEEQFEYQQEHDRRKKEYADKNNIKLLPIWYWDFNNIEEILDKKLKI